MGNEQDDLTIARREVFDIRTQLMAEDSEQDNEELISGLEHGDLKPNFYEGGFKTWECALDLAKRVVGDYAVGEVDGDRHVIEVGVFLIASYALVLTWVAWCWYGSTISGAVRAASLRVDATAEDSLYFCGL